LRLDDENAFIEKIGKNLSVTTNLIGIELKNRNIYMTCKTVAQAQSKQTEGFV
jgi:hypothetical protein